MKEENYYLNEIEYKILNLEFKIQKYFLETTHAICLICSCLKERNIQLAFGRIRALRETRSDCKWSGCFQISTNKEKMPGCAIQLIFRRSWVRSSGQAT